MPNENKVILATRLDGTSEEEFIFVVVPPDRDDKPPWHVIEEFATVMFGHPKWSSPPISDFMFMHETNLFSTDYHSKTKNMVVKWTKNPGKWSYMSDLGHELNLVRKYLYFFKHVDSRRYLIIDNLNKTYRTLENGQPKYQEITQQEAIDYVLS